MCCHLKQKPCIKTCVRTDAQMANDEQRGLMQPCGLLFPLPWRQQVSGSVVPRVSSCGLLTGGQLPAAGPCCPAGLPEGLIQLPVLHQTISFFQVADSEACFEQSIAPPVPKVHDLLTRVKKIILRWPPFTVFLYSLCGSLRLKPFLIA